MEINSREHLKKVCLYKTFVFFKHIFMFIGVPTDGHMTAGPLSNNNHAIQRCPVVCEKIKLKWNGHWFTTIKDVMSVCRCVT